MRISAASLMYLLVPVTAPRDPTADAVQMAFSPAYDPDLEQTGFVSAGWQAPAIPNQDGSWTAYARCLVGPGGTVALPVGNYKIWTKVTDSPEIPVLASDILTVF
jgi:hypothetical protein